MSDSGEFPAVGRGARGSRSDRGKPLLPPGTTAVTFQHLGTDHRGRIEERTPIELALALDPFDGELLLFPGQDVCIRAEGGAAECLARAMSVRCRDGGYHVRVELRPPASAKLDLDRVKIDPSVALRVPPMLAFRRGILPFGRADGVVSLACIDTTDIAAVQAVERVFQCPVRPLAAEPESLRRALVRVYGQPDSAGGAVRVGSLDLSSMAELEPEGAVTLGDEILHAAALREASDIHIDPGREGVVVRMRVDGVLELYRRLSTAAHAGLVSRLKVMSGMNIAERRAPQDGGFKYTFPTTNQPIDIRAAVLPTKFGERMTLRLLSIQAESLTLDRLGMAPLDLAKFEQALDQPHGLILLTGPTGSGKSTTLAAGLRQIMARESLNVLTVEDPIEYEIAGAAQVEVDAADKVSFGRALRSLLRHDPDVIMIGEIRDAETARVAIQASLTGHLVFSTLHTNTAAGVVTRLADMGVESYLVGASLRLAVAQRLVRRLCSSCSRPHALTVAEAASLGRPKLAGLEVREAGGCVYCGGRGYHGRVGLFDLFPIDSEVGRRIADGAREGDLIAETRRSAATTLVDDATAKLRCGLTSVREVQTAVTVW